MNCYTQPHPPTPSPEIETLRVISGEGDRPRDVIIGDQNITAILQVPSYAPTRPRSAAVVG